MTNIRLIIAFVFSLTITLCSFGQEDSIGKNDSINKSLLKEFSAKLKAIEQQRLQDLAKKSDLENQLKQLKTTENLKKEELLRQLAILKSNEVTRLQEKKSRIDALRKNARPFPVKGFFNDTLFSIYTSYGSFTAADRAAAISERIHKMAEKYNFEDKNLKVLEIENAFMVMNDEKIIMSISENDALWNNTTKEALAQKYRDVMAKAVIDYQNETSVMTLLKEIGQAAVVIIILWVILLYVGRFFRWLAVKIGQQKGKRLNGLRIRNYTLFDASRQVAVFLYLNTILKWVVIFLLVYIALPIVFGFFPWTENFAQTLFGYIFDPLKKIGRGIWDFMPNLFTIIVIVLVFTYAIKGLRYLKNEIEAGKLQLPGFYPDWASPTFQILRITLYAFMLVMIFPNIPGSDSPIFRGVSVFLGFLFTFGSAGSLSNLVAGIVLTYMRQFKVGDRVKIGEVVGDVIEKSMLVTRIKTIKNEIVSIPHSTVMSSHTVNYSNEAETGNGLIVYTTVTIGYDVPWPKIHKALIDAAGRTDLILNDPTPFVLQTSLDDFYVSYQINAYTKEPNKQAEIYSDLHQNIQDCCNEAEIEILSPHFRYQRDGNMTTIPAHYLPKDYQAPSFNINIKKES